MKKILFFILCISCLPTAARGQTLEDAVLAELFQPKSPHVLRYWFDEDTNTLQTANGTAGAYMLDVSALTEGLHTLHYLLEGADGTGYDIKTETFFKMGDLLAHTTIGTSVAAKGIVYWFDSDDSNKKTIDHMQDAYAFDVSALEDGLHLLYYYLVGEDGLPYGLTSVMFLKDEAQYIQREPNRITKYQYWLNDNDIIQTVTLDQPNNPYTLMTLLPVQQCPIRSSSFHFQMVEGVPTLYAKNDFHVRFHDAQGYFVDAQKDYIDYHVSQPVETVGELQESQSFSRLGDNEIRWYQLDVEEGDSLWFMLDKAATIQLFAPSGEEVYQASGAASVGGGGCHAPEDGTFYLAVHDVTAKNGNVISLQYQHIDKYAVLGQNVSVVGNGGCSTIAFTGNGFRDLYAVDLFTAQGDTIHHAWIEHESNVRASVTFDFSDAVLGVYDAVFHFTEEDKVLPAIMTVEEAKPIDITTTVSYSPYFTAGRPTHYVIKVTNGGNATAYGVPVEIRVKSEDFPVNRIVLGGLVPSVYDMLATADMSAEDAEELKRLSDSMGDSHCFLSSEDGLSLMGMFLINIPPNRER